MKLFTNTSCHFSFQVEAYILVDYVLLSIFHSFYVARSWSYEIVHTLSHLLVGKGLINIWDWKFVEKLRVCLCICLGEC